MSNSIITEYPIWFLIFCLIGGVLFSLFLYRKDKKLNEVPKIVIKVMFGLRFVSVSIIMFLLLSPMLKTLGKNLEKPIIIFAQDNSESIKSKKFDILNYKTKCSELFSNLSEKYNFKQVSFGASVTDSCVFSFSEKETDISQMISELNAKYYNQNIGAIIFASDGIYNRGTNPLYEISDLNFPIYTLALGDTGVKKDLILSDINYNKIAFLNNKFPVQIEVIGKKIKGKETEVKIFDKSKLLFTQKIKIDSDDFYKKINFEIEATEVGVRQLNVTLAAVESEVSLQNNFKTIAVEIIDTKQKIAIIANSPHPDIAAIKSALENNQNYEIEYFTASEFKKNIKEFNLVVLHQIPSLINSATSILSEITNNNIPVLYILGSQSALKPFNNQLSGLTVNQRNKTFDEVQGVLNPNFSLFEINPETNKIISESPPLSSAFGEYVISANTQILCFRTVKNIQTNYPLITINQNSSNKTAVITGEGLWRWRIFEYKKNQNNFLFNELINKIIQYLTIKEDKDRFRVTYEKIIPENRQVNFTAEVYSKNYELINKDQVTLQITDSLKKNYDFTFEKSSKSYYINVGVLHPGEYKWKAETILDGKKISKTGNIAVIPLHLEAENTVANHKLLKQISDKTNARMFNLSEFNKIQKVIEENKNIVTIAHIEKKTESFLQWTLIFFIILGLITLEWFLRKFYGAY